LKSHGHKLNNEETIHKAGIKSGDTIEVDHSQITIKVKNVVFEEINSKDYYEFEIDPDLKVKEIAVKIHSFKSEFK
jgi:hypothetical protein